MTRQNLLPSCDGERQVNALIPLWDLCNHDDGKVSFCQLALTSHH